MRKALVPIAMLTMQPTWTVKEPRTVLALRTTDMDGEIDVFPGESVPSCYILIYTAD